VKNLKKINRYETSGSTIVGTQQQRENRMTDVIVRAPSAPRIDAYKVALTYAIAVLKGELVVGKLTTLAAKRFIEDLKYGPARGITFDKNSAQHVVDFIGTLRQWKGEWGLRGGEPINLQPWQVFILANLFGFKRADSTRRFREVHIEIGRKNGKTTLMAAVALYMLVADDEPGAEVYCIATKKDQAREVFDCAVELRNKSRFLASKIITSGGTAPSNMSVLSSASKFQLQASDYGTADGKNVHCLIADELHQHPTRLLWDAYKESTVARRQSLCIAITTAGYNQAGFCYTQRQRIENILTGNVSVADADHVFGYIACIDAPDKDGKNGDDWKNEKCWAKANPNLGASVKIDALREMCANAKMDNTALNTFLCKHLNVWVNQEVRWMNPEKWAKCNSAGPRANPIELREQAMKALEGRLAIAAFDLSSKEDLTSFVLLFPPCKAQTERVAKPQTQNQIHFKMPVEYEEKIIIAEDLRWSVLPWFWVPEDSVAERVKKARVNYDVWVREKLLNTCPGATINHEFIYKSIIDIRKRFQFQNIAFDDWNAQWIANKLKEDGFKTESVKMVYSVMSEPMKELMGMVLEKKLEHYGNPILTWNANNVSATVNPNGDVRPDKEKSKEKIDGIVAMIMALSLVCHNPTLTQSSVYSDRGIVFL
jgi:phage terminase large subunit-like protein